MSALLDNFINGNLSDAKAKAKRVSHHKLRTEMEEDYGYTPVAATAVADYLKGSISFQQHCDIVHREKDAGRM